MLNFECINLDGSIRNKLDEYDYGLTESDAEYEYYEFLKEGKENDVSSY